MEQWEAEGKQEAHRLRQIEKFKQGKLGPESLPASDGGVTSEVSNLNVDG
jgi:hypothetical protein